MIIDCSNRSMTKGYCIKHYAKLQRYGDATARRYDSSRGCQIIGCKNKHSCHGYCNSHYKVNYQQELKLELMNVLCQSKCIHCGFNDSRALQFDHIFGDGAKDSKTSSTAKMRYYITHPDEARKRLQILCANCNWIKRAENNETGHKWR